MYILMGLLLSKLFANLGKPLFFKGFSGVVEIKHSIPGRVRFHSPVLKTDSDNGLLLERQLLQAGAIKEVKVSPITSTVVITYDEDKIDIMTLTAVLIKLLGLEKNLEKTPKSLVGAEVSKLLKSANRSIYEQTNGTLDLNTTITLTFLSFGIWSIIKNPSVFPNGINLMYWAYKNSLTEIK